MHLVDDTSDSISAGLQRHENPLLELSGSAAPLDSSYACGARAPPPPPLGLPLRDQVQYRRHEWLKGILNYFGIGIEDVGKSGGLMLLWRKDSDVWIQSFSNRHIDATVQFQEGTDRWHFTGFYDHPETERVVLTVGNVSFLMLEFSPRESSDQITRYYGLTSNQQSISSREGEPNISVLRQYGLGQKIVNRLSSNDKLEELYSQEELLWQQRAKALWLKEGDKNTAFFHARASERRDRKAIKALIDDGECLREGKDVVRDVGLRYFEHIFQSTNLQQVVMRESIGTLTPRVTEDMNAMLTQPFTMEEVNLALKQMHPLKSPGPDGMSPIFYKKMLAHCRQ
ncbi:UNVERIFIED_CONTAM: hypothetical protein Slati_4461000 [Sesamum latifolium]|uniref:Uncharacterized protein n=1 Tax=Sesamum latifolium TaxID=2727402 RepID=A0AAW2SRC2_9LAMI